MSNYNLEGGSTPKERRIIGTLGIAATFCFAYGLGSVMSSPSKVYTADVNNDNLPDIVTRSVMYDTDVFLGQEDGSFRSLDEVFRVRKQILEQSTEELDLEKEALVEKAKGEE